MAIVGQRGKISGAGSHVVHGRLETDNPSIQPGRHAHPLAKPAFQGSFANPELASYLGNTSEFRVLGNQIIRGSQRSPFLVDPSLSQ